MYSEEQERYNVIKDEIEVFDKLLIQSFAVNRREKYKSLF